VYEIIICQCQGTLTEGKAIYFAQKCGVADFRASFRWLDTLCLKFFRFYLKANYKK